MSRRFAGYLKAAKDIGQSYQESYSRQWGSGVGGSDDVRDIPGAFPDVSFYSHGDSQLLLFPSYAKQHTKVAPSPETQSQGSDNEQADDARDSDYWAREWQKFEDDQAIVEVDIRGWVYSPHKGPLNRKNRLMIGLARQLSGIPAPQTSKSELPGSEGGLREKHREHEAQREQEKISEEMEQILRKGEGEQDVAARGGYSEKPDNGQEEYNRLGRNNFRKPGTSHDDVPMPGSIAKRPSWSQPSQMTQAELIIANTNLMARLSPFLTNPMAWTPVTIFFYNESSSISRTVTTNDAGHFSLREPLEFVPTHARILASENLSATQEIKVSEAKGVTLISDVDDTVKHTAISSGARESFRNAFVHELSDLQIDGVKQWYNKMYDMGVGIHYVSNAPWQLLPVLLSFFKKAGMPPGSCHLKQYSGMLQGIFEPVAERKKGTLERIMKDFPERRFILIGDSGEADLEVYTDVVLANPGKIIGIFIRDVTTPHSQTTYDPLLGPLSSDSGRNSTPRSLNASRDSSRGGSGPEDSLSDYRPTLPRRPISDNQAGVGGNLIDLDGNFDSDHQLRRRATSPPMPSSATRSVSAAPGKRAPPPRPVKPTTLRSTPSTNTSVPSEPEVIKGKILPPPPPKPRRSQFQQQQQQQQRNISPHPLSQARNPAETSANRSSPGQRENNYLSSARNKVSEAYNALPEMRSYLPNSASATGTLASRRSRETLAQTTNTDSDIGPPPLPPRRVETASSVNSMPNRISRVSTTDESNMTSNTMSNNTAALPANKKFDLWKRRWRHAKDILEDKGVPLRAWRVGSDVSVEAVELVQKTLKEIGVDSSKTPVKGRR